MMFPEDDEMEPQEELNQVNQAMGSMAQRRDYLKREVAKKKMDPKDEKLVEVAWRAGQGEAETKALRNRIRFLERRIAVRDEKLEEHSDYWHWRNRAEAAELKLAKRRKRK